MTDQDALLERYSAPIREQLGRQSDAIDRMATAIADMARAIAVSEEKHSNTADALARIGNRIDDHEKRLRELERSDAAQGLFVKHAGKFTWTAIGIAMSMVFAFLFGGKVG